MSDFFFWVLIVLSLGIVFSACYSIYQSTRKSVRKVRQYMQERDDRD